jgi:RNA recognition motif-containing protein
MSWTQVYVTGLSQTNDPTDEELEGLLDARYSLSAAATATEEDNNNNMSMTWAGPGSTLVKRDKNTGACRGYAFLSFFSTHGASIAVDRINDYSYSSRQREGAGDEYEVHAAGNDNVDDDDDDPSLLLPRQLRAELSKPNAKSGRKKQTNNESGQGEDHSDLRLRRKRAPAVRKHPVIMNSDKTKTGLGNKTR